MMHFGEQFTDEEVEEMIAEADSNQDGKIDYAEFSQMILKEINMDNKEQQRHYSHSIKRESQDDDKVQQFVSHQQKSVEIEEDSESEFQVKSVVRNGKITTDV